MVGMIERFVPEIGKRPKKNIKRRRRVRKRKRKKRKKKKNLLDMVLADLKSNVAPPGYKRLSGPNPKRVHWAE